MSTCYEPGVSPRVRPVLRCTGGVTAQPSPEIMAPSSASPTKDQGPLRWGLPDSMVLPNKLDKDSRPNSASSSDLSSSGSDLPSTNRSEVKCGYDKIDMSFILGDEQEQEDDEIPESAESEASRISYRRQLRRQFGSRSVVQNTGGQKGQEESSSSEDEDEVEVIYKADEENKNSAVSDMDTDSAEEVSEEEIETEDEEKDEPEEEDDEEPEEMIVKETDDDESESEGGWISDEAETEQPSKRLKTSKQGESESEEESEDEKNETDSDDEKKSEGGVDMSAFFDLDDPVYSYPTGPIKMSVEAIAEYKQEEYGGNRYYNISSEDMGLDSIRKRNESESDDDDDFCISCFSKSAGLSYAFPRVTPRRIELLIKFWENDFQVGDFVYPKMSLWESKGIAPDRKNHPAADCRKYGAYKSLYTKWQECNRSREQWYRKYRGNSLVDIANGRFDSAVQKQKTDSTFKSICSVDIAAQCSSGSSYGRHTQRSNPNKTTHGGFSRTVVY